MKPPKLGSLNKCRVESAENLVQNFNAALLAILAIYLHSIKGFLSHEVDQMRIEETLQERALDRQHAVMHACSPVVAVPFALPHLVLSRSVLLYQHRWHQSFYFRLKRPRQL